MTDDFFGDDDDPSSLPDNHTSTLLRPSSPTHTSLDYHQTTSYQSSSRPDTSSHRHQTSSRRADTSSRRGAADTSSLARGRSPDLDLDDILAGMDVDHDGVEGGVGGGERSVVRLERCLANEQGAPELLEFPVELVEGLVTDLAARNGLVREAQDTQHQDEQFYIATDLVAVENMRASWVLKQFTRWRLYKLELHTQHYIDEIDDALEQGQDPPRRLYHNEEDFARGLLRITGEYLTAAAMGAMPEQVTSQAQPVVHPDLSQAVFVRVRKACGPVVMPDGSLFDLEPGQQSLFRYSTVRALIASGHVECI